jgi:hypothetical protein
MNRLTTIACVAACLFANTAAAQLAPPQYPLLELSIGLTGMSRGPGKGSEGALTAMGFHEGYGNQGMTHTDLNGFWKVEIGVSERRSVGFLTTRVANRTRGVREAPGTGTSMAAQHAVITRAVTWSYRPNGWVSFGAGPALHTRRFAIDAPYGPDVAVQSKRGLGAVAGVNVKWKRENGTFAHALWQYRYAGSLGSGDATVPIGLRNGAPLQSVNWPTTRIPFSHRMIGVGIGIEF